VPTLFWKTGLNDQPVLLAAGRVVTEEGDIAAAAGSRAFLFVPDEREYRQYAAFDVTANITGLAVQKTELTPDNIVVGTAERIFVWGNRQGIISPFWQTEVEAGAGFTDVAAGDLNGDRRDEIVAAASGQDSIYVYRLVGETAVGLRLELAGIRLVPGTPRFVTVYKRPGRSPAIAVAYEKDGMSGLAVYSLTEAGFEAGPVLENLPFRITALVSGNFTRHEGSELAVGEAGGTIRLIGTGRKLEVLALTDSLGTAVSALAASGTETENLTAGTPEGNVFVFNFPVGKSPDLAFSPGEGVTGLAVLSPDRTAVGTAAGGVQVWSLTGNADTVRYTVRPGDSLWKIAHKFGVPLEKIISINKNITNPEAVVPGQVIKIPVQ
jgi:nucleoid-associated protein YgaU